MALWKETWLANNIVQTAATTVQCLVRTHCNPKIESAQETIRQPTAKRG
jgi:hypothetical protein